MAVGFEAGQGHRDPWILGELAFWQSRAQPMDPPGEPVTSGIAEPYRRMIEGDWHTSRELGVLTLLTEGHTNVEIARRLHLSVKTIDHHVSSILDKLDAHSRAEAVSAAFGFGIVKWT